MNGPGPSFKMFFRRTGKGHSAFRCGFIKPSALLLLLAFFLYGRSLPGTSACFTQRIEAGTVQITAGVWQTDESLSQSLTAELADGLFTLRVPLAESEIDTKTVLLRCGDNTAAPAEVTFEDGLLTAVFEWESVRGFFECETPQTVTLSVLQYSLSVPAPASAPPAAEKPPETRESLPAPPDAGGENPPEAPKEPDGGENSAGEDSGGDEETEAANTLNARLP